MSRPPANWQMGRSPGSVPALPVEMDFAVTQDDLHFDRAVRVTANIGPVEAAYAVLADYFAGRDWIADAACGSTDGDAWFPEKGGSTHYARKICGQCPVRAQCRADALDRGEPFGIWGDLSVAEREGVARRAVAA